MLNSRVFLHQLKKSMRHHILSSVAKITTFLKDISLMHQLSWSILIKDVNLTLIMILFPSRFCMRNAQSAIIYRSMMEFFIVL